MIKSQSPNSLVNWEKFESTIKIYIFKKKQFSIFFMNWEKLISSDRATLKNLKKFFVNWEKREYTA